MEGNTDYTVENHGSIFLVRPQNDAARDYLMSVTEGMWIGGGHGALAVEHRFAEGLVEGLRNDGYTVS